MANSNNNSVAKTFKVNYVAPGTWRQLFLIKDNELHKTRERFVYDRSSHIPSIFVGTDVHIYTGRKFHLKKVNRWMVGFRFGEFTWNRKLALYKAKQLKKKKKK